MQAHHNGVGYKVIQGGAAMGYDELRLPFGSKPLLVVPVISGSGGGSTTQILLGLVWSLLCESCCRIRIGRSCGVWCWLDSAAAGATAPLGACITALEAILVLH